MYENFFLDKNQLDIISNWLTKNGPNFLLLVVLGNSSLSKRNI